MTAWCPNPGAMTGCAGEGWTVWVSAATGAARKLKWTWEVCENPHGASILVHTGRTNDLAEEAVEAGFLPTLSGYTSLRREVKMGERSRVDLVLDAPGRRTCWVEVKAVTLPVAGGLGAFPDSVTKRGRRHLEELTARVAAGDRAVQLYVLARTDLVRLKPADAIDPAYGEALRAAAAAGVELAALTVAIDGRAVRPVGPGSVQLS